MNRYLEIVGVALVLLTASYFVPIEDVARQAVDPVMTEALLPRETVVQKDSSEITSASTGDSVTIA